MVPRFDPHPAPSVYSVRVLDGHAGVPEGIMRQEKRPSVNCTSALSMAAELYDIEQAVRGGVLLTEALRDTQLDPDRLREVPAAVVSALALVQDRLHRLRLAVMGDLDPAALLWRHNSVLRDAVADAREDVFLLPWEPSRKPVATVKGPLRRVQNNRD